MGSQRVSWWLYGWVWVLMWLSHGEGLEERVGQFELVFVLPVMRLGT
jgi:hypothetical protein